MRAELRVVLGALLCGLLAPGDARAYCRSTTCSPEHESCATDDHGCLVDGQPLFWAEPCITVWLPNEREPLRGIDQATFAEVTRDAFERWSEVDCGSGGRTVEVQVGGTLECALTGFDLQASLNVNTLRVVRDEWAHQGLLTELALTTVTSLAATGEILDADIEINEVDGAFATDGGAGADLLSTLVHEAGHALGLAHSDEPDATMYWTTRGGTSMRTLSGDDEAGICAIYPQPAFDACDGEAQRDPVDVCRAVVTPRSATRSGCSVGALAAEHAGPGGWLALAFGALGLGSRARARSATARPRGSCGSSQSLANSTAGKSTPGANARHATATSSAASPCGGSRARQ